MKALQRNDGNRSGFTLVELAITSFLIAMGLLAVYALLRSGLESGEEQEKDVRGAFFADSVVGTLSAASDYAAQSGGTTNWVEFWEAFFDGSTNLPLVGATSDDWPVAGASTRDFSSAESSRVLSGDGLHAYHYVFYAAGQDQACVSNTVWYDFSEPTWLPDEEKPGAIGVTLHVWPESPQSSAQTYFHMFCLERPPEP